MNSNPAPIALALANIDKLISVNKMPWLKSIRESLAPQPLSDINLKIPNLSKLGSSSMQTPKAAGQSPPSQITLESPLSTNFSRKSSAPDEVNQNVIILSSARNSNANIPQVLKGTTLPSILKTGARSRFSKDKKADKAATKDLLGIPEDSESLNLYAVLQKLLLSD